MDRGIRDILRRSSESLAGVIQYQHTPVPKMAIEVARAASIAETPISRMSSAEFWIRLMTSAEFAKFQYGFRQNLGSSEIPPARVITGFVNFISGISVSSISSTDSY